MEILVSGAGVAGLATAEWLHRIGHTPTVVERMPSPRSGGHAIDVRGVALDVVDRMGAGAAVRAARTEMTGMSVVDETGQEIMRSTEFALSSGRLDSDDVEILREDLTAALADALSPDVDVVFDEAIATLTEDADGVDVTFRSGRTARFDLVVGADGLHSATRRLAFGDPRDVVHHLGAYLGVFTAPNMLDLDRWQTWLRAPNVGGVVYTARDNTELRVNLGFGSPALEIDHRDVAAQKRLLADHLDGLGWVVPQLVDAMWAADDFYFDAMAQVCMPAWSTGRVVLVGDAGYCPSPLSGQGTSLALVGAYVLADALREHPDDHRAGLAAYERRLRPFVETNQALATENPGEPPSDESAERAKNAIDLDEGRDRASA